MASSSSSSSSATEWKYDVFLSFRGPDTRASFIDHLYASLRQRGIQVFKDDSELERGRPISDILTAIEQSRFFLIVFSKNYADSSWCLDELDKISECCCKDGAGRQTAIPIFYDVDPSEVQEQTGRYGEAFLEHERVFEDKIDQVHRWRKAMTELANLSGWHLQKQNRGEVDFIGEVAGHIHSKLRKSELFSSIDAGDYVGMDSHLEKLSPYLKTVEESNDVLFIGICGIGGVGKSTLAKFVYSKMSCQFEGSGFLENIRVVKEKEGGLAGLQRQLLIQVMGIDKNKIRIWSGHEGIGEIKMRLYRKRVLVILDNVNHLNQLKSLAGGSHWFGRGSRIIITTRDEHLLKCHGVSIIYKMGELGEDEALKLFSWRAFRNYTPAEGYEELSREFIAYSSGLPLALTVLGSYVNGRSINEWKSALDKLKKCPNKEISETLRTSFDGLDKSEKEIFLDIACFFVGEDINFLNRIFESCEFYPDVGITDLIDKSLITIFQNKVWMHDLLQQLGQDIIREEHKEVGYRSRIWLCEDLWHTLSNNMGSEQVEGIVLNINSQKVHESTSSESFLKMKKLRLLRHPNLHSLQGQEYLSNELRYLRGNGYPFKSLPSGFHPDKLVELHLSYSNIKQLWKRKQPPLPMLKVINLSYSQNLIKTPDFSEIPNLEELILEGCTRLREVHHSIGELERLVVLDLKDCKSLKEVPSTICDVKPLKNLILHGCPAVYKLPEKLGDLTCLEVLDLGRDVENEQPPTRPWDFLLRPWQSLPWKDPSLAAVTLPSLSTLHFLRDLNLSYCKLRDGAIPNDLGCFPLLERLDLSGNDFKSLPTSIGQLSNLCDLVLCNCSSVKSLPDLPTSMDHLYMDGCTCLETLPNNTSGLCNLSGLHIDNCVSLRTLPDLPSQLGDLEMSNCSSLETPPDFLGDHTRPYLFMGFLNCAKFSEKQYVFGWVKKLLHSLKNKEQPFIEVLMSYTGGGIPGWFNYVSEGSSLKVELPPYWCNNDFLGLSIFAVLGVKHSAADEYFSIEAKAWTKTENPVSFTLHKTTYCRSCRSVDTCWNSDVVLFQFMSRGSKSGDWRNSIPRGKSESADWWNSLSHLEVTILEKGLKPKYIGLRIVYEQDVEELSRWSDWTSSSPPPFHNVASTNKRSHDDDDDSGSSDSRVKTRPSTKRLKL